MENRHFGKISIHSTLPVAPVRPAAADIRHPFSAARTKGGTVLTDEMRRRPPALPVAYQSGIFPQVLPLSLSKKKNAKRFSDRAEATASTPEPRVCRSSPPSPPPSLLLPQSLRSTLTTCEAQADGLALVFGGNTRWMTPR